MNWGEYMRRIISYYYHLEPKDIHQTKDYYDFIYNNEQYRIEQIKNINVDEVYDRMIYLRNNGIYVHEIIPTVENKLYIVYEQRKYALIKYIGNIGRKITKKDLLTFSNIKINVESKNWGKLWSEKIDYFEYQMSQFGMKYKNIRETFAYYIGLAEMGISLFNNYKIDDSYIQHYRINEKTTLYDLYDPFNIVYDLKVRDMASYYKTKYINDNLDINEIFTYLDTLDNYNKIMFFIRMFYPSFYFDEYEKVVNYTQDENDIIKIIKKSKNYHLLLKKIYDFLLLKINMPYIELFINPIQ